MDSVRILVVDDDATNRALVRACLSPPYEVVEAADGERALALSEERAFDLVLLDVRMPKLDGFDVCRAIKARAADGFLPVILLTALNLPEDRIQGLAAGADDFLTKPLDRRELLLRIRPFLRLREQEASLRAQQTVIQKQLDELNDLQLLKDDLFSLLVHDLRNPLAGVVGFLELLQLELVDPGQARARQHADRAAAGTRKLKGLLEEVLQVQELEQAGLPLKRTSVALGELVRDAAATLEGAGRARRVAVEVELAPAPALSLDPGLTRRALENLVSNALKFAPEDSTVTVSLRSEQERVVVQPPLAKPTRAVWLEISGHRPDRFEGMKQVDLGPLEIALETAQPEPLLLSGRLALDDLPCQAARLDLRSRQERAHRSRPPRVWFGFRPWICIAGLGPSVDLRELELTQPAYPVGEQLLRFDPVVNCIAGDAQLFGYTFDKQPRFLIWHRHVQMREVLLSCTYRNR